MIPLQLILKNFLSYREASLDFRGLHTACICGANGAGKSSLLEAITWVIWGQSRASSEDDVIYAGAENVRVDFEFICSNQQYRIIRTRQRGKGASLDFQIASSSGFRSLNEKGIRATQEQIIFSLKLDYDTFINSAYLRQGRADEFMQRRPNERKQILADLLKLEQYEHLANKAKDLSKLYKGQMQQLEESKGRLSEQLEQKDAIAMQKVTVEQDIKQLQQEQDRDREKLQQIQAVQHQLQNWQQQLTWHRNQYNNIVQECDRLKTEQSEINNRLAELKTLLNQEEEIYSKYQDLLRLQQEEESLSTKFQAYQNSQQQKQQLEQKFLKQTNELKLEIQKNKSRLEHLQQQEHEIQQILKNSADIEVGLEKLQEFRQRLNELDQLQHQIAPLLQRRYTLQTEIERTQARLTAKLEQLQEEETKLSSSLDKIPKVRQEALRVYSQIQELEKKEIYKQRVKEKGTERKTRKQQLEETQHLYEKQLKELSQKLDLLEIPEAICPLCEQELDEHHRHHVTAKTETQQREIQEQIWQIKESIAVGERELQSLRTEYSQLTQELTSYPSLQQYFGQLEAQLESSGDLKIKLNKIRSEITEIEEALLSGHYAPKLQSELQSLEQELNNLNYDEQTHAIVRAEEKRWRWAEIKQAKLEDANRRQAKINQDKPQLLERITVLETDLEQLGKNSKIQREIEAAEQALSQLGYDPIYHQTLRNTLRHEQTWQFRYQQLQQAKQQYPQLQEKVNAVEQRLKIQNPITIQQQIDQIVAQIESLPNAQEVIQELEPNIQQRRHKLDELLAKKGSLEQALKQIENLKQEYEINRQQLKEYKKKCRIYQELAQAFGKNGIQALMIENILPQLEAETNQILNRLTGNQLHVQFLTQKSGKSNRQKATAKLIDTLDILIADARGTRPYETYSGGEAFRINFSIRLALAKLLAQRAGTSLQMLIIDEGFGTQDTEGCDRLIAAINAIASEFSCILTVTHMPQFKEAFQHRIEVRKTNQGSQLILSN